uniref:NAD(+) kinase n=1 Tax=Timspurckia oligopyrenoides TaxID=708627 RepID=A0A7S1EQG3_9RHOD|mmetsp:Transcript_12120/g.21911  ORF Transcript_12120/g.21911 Transcript_12120/m.21911 type:complete len:396 (+) Transcript_12120:102-1289(+)|eukprot:CAMPEP_0182447024 /NCGR_PEP_ID=MMETSP1172-20130603/10370_1 /TAXON_ID=708627 /ORGANISM="Timspurckia oligopyrenoides, Strain CCMP3278" /LENGTH=395 /DNA_ID=CAMNT_0024643275 /DNA_START=93 /DNA_END=1280 /DNA_ORIENTATION=-
MISRGFECLKYGLNAFHSYQNLSRIRVFCSVNVYKCQFSSNSGFDKQSSNTFLIQYGSRVLAQVEKSTSLQESNLKWMRIPSTVLLMRSNASEIAIEKAPSVVHFLLDELHLRVLTDYDTVADCSKAHVKSSALEVFGSHNRESVDLVICLGGDGLLLHICSDLFGRSVPPVVAFNLGSLGFMNPFEFSQIRPVLRRILRTDILHSATVRQRFSLSISRRDLGADGNGIYRAEQHEVLNDVVLERGLDPGLSNLEAYCDDVLLTRVQADGLVVATPTGSTAYSLSANGSIVHPSVSAILMTPICPHTLSFRPIILPDTCCLTIRPSDTARRGASLRVDGRAVGRLAKNESLLVRKSSWPVVCFAKTSCSEDWYASVRKCLHWNEMMMEMPFEVDS